MGGTYTIIFQNAQNWSLHLNIIYHFSNTSLWSDSIKGICWCFFESELNHVLWH